MSVVVFTSRSVRAVLALSLCWSAAQALDFAPAAPPPLIQGVSPPDNAGLQADLQKIVGRELQETREQGFIGISEDEADSFMHEQLAPLFGHPGDIAQHIQLLYGLAASTMPLRLEGLIGIIAPNAPDHYYSVVRVYTLPGNITVTLEETDFASIGAQVAQVEAMINTEINGYPGTATYRRAPQRKGLILVSWITESRLLKLSLAGVDVGPEQSVTALQLARAVK